MREDFRFALRVLRKQPLFSAAAILTLVIGIGVNTAVFSVLDAVVFRPLPFAQPEQLVRVWSTNAAENKEREGVSPADFVDFSNEVSALAGMAAWQYASRTLRVRELPEEVAVALVSPTFFDVFGISAEAGRTFGTAEREESVALFGRALAEQQLGAPRDAVGQVVEVEGEPFEVIGVVGPELTSLVGEAQLFLPLELVPEQHRFRRNLGVIGRLAAGHDLEQAQTELDLVAARLEEAHPRSNTGWRTRLVPLRDQILGETGRHLALLAGAGGFLLLITCGNVAALLFARSMGRRREMAVRHAIGASRLALLRQLLIEGQVLTWIAGALAILAGNWALKLLLRFEPGNLPRIDEISLDARTLAFTFGVAVVTGLLFGVMVSLRAATHEELRQSGSQPGYGVQRRLSALMVAEIAAAMVLLLGSVLLLRSFDQLRKVDPGFRFEGVLDAWIALDRGRYPENSDKIVYFRRLLERVRDLPEVEAAGLVTALPLSPVGIDFDVEYEVVGAPEPEHSPQALMRVVSAGYFETLETPWIAGRRFDDTDRQDSQKVVIVNEAFARREWPDRDPLAREIRIFGGTHSVVGVVGNTRFYGLDAAVREELFVPLEQIPWYPSMHLVARTAATDPAALAPAIRREVLAVDPAQPPSSVTTMGQLLSDSLGRDRFLTLLVGLMGVIAVLQAAAGIFGTMSYGVLQRQQEISIRMALGARRRQILSWVLRRGLVLGAAGIGIGLAAGWGLGRVVRELVYGITVHDPHSFAVAAAAMLTLICVASLLPAYWASRIEPMSTLRAQ